MKRLKIFLLYFAACFFVLSNHTMARVNATPTPFEAELYLKCYQLSQDLHDLTGDIKMVISIDSNGAVKTVHMVESSLVPKSDSTRALTSVRAWRFTEAKTSVDIIVRITFGIDQRRVVSRIVGISAIGIPAICFLGFIITMALVLVFT
jgi:hypothetical protein